MDPLRLSELFDAHAPALLLYARQWLGRSAAEDAVQEAFVRLLVQSGDPANARAWLFTTVRNEAISQARALSRRQRRETKVMDQAWFEPADIDGIDGMYARQVMETLPADQREVIVLRIWAGMKLKEIASVVGSPVSTVFDQYRKGLDQIRRQMGALCQNKTS